MRWGRIVQSVIFVLCAGALFSPPHGGWWLIWDGINALLCLIYGRSIVRWVNADALEESEAPQAPQEIQRGSDHEE